MGFFTQDRMVTEQRVTNDAKSRGVADLLRFFLGLLGVCRYYLGCKGIGLLILLVTVVARLTSGFVSLSIVGIRPFVDLFLIPELVKKQKDEVRERLTMQAW